MTTRGFQHPSTRIKSSNSAFLEGKRIVLGITGSVAAFLSPAIARELIRHGAEVIPVMTTESLNMIGKNLMWWATGVEPITEVTGNLEHISMAGVMNDPVDLMLIAPCTTNTVGKLATGIADTSVTLIASSLNGKGIPLMVLAVAHEDLINSPPIQESLEKLRTWGISVIEPVLSEGKAKVPELEDVVFEVLTKLARVGLAGRNVIATGGPTREYIDKVRYITNGSSGRMGLELAKAAKLNGGSVTLVMGSHSLFIPRSLPTIDVISTQDMVDAVMTQLETAPDSIVILSSAMADFKPTSPQTGKIKSGESLSVELEPTVKLSDLIKTKYPQSYLVLFKAEWDVSPEELHHRALEKLHKTSGDLIIANDLSRPGAGFQTITNHVLIIDNQGNSEEASSTKIDLSFQIIDRIIRQLNMNR